MRKISIIATDYNSEDLKEVLGKLNSMFYRQYHYELILFEGRENLDSYTSISNLKIIRLKKKLTLNQKITTAFEVSDGACTILADFTTLDCYKYIQNLLQLWQNGANVVLTKHKDFEKKFSNKFKTGFYNLVANIFGMYEASNCNNTFQLFSKCVADVIKKSPQQNAYLRNTRAWQDYKVMIVTTNNFIKVKENVQKFTALDKFWSFLSILGSIMLGAFAGFGYNMFSAFESAKIVGTSYLFVALSALIIGVPSLLVGRVKNKYGNCYKKEACEYLFDKNVRRLFDLDLYDERDAGLKSIHFNATMVKDTKEVNTKTYNHNYERYVPQFLKDGTIAPKKKMDFVGAQSGPVLYSYLSTAQVVNNNQLSVSVPLTNSNKIKTSTKAKELNETIKKLTQKDEGKVVLKNKTVKNTSVKQGDIISTSSPIKTTNQKVSAKKETATPQKNAETKKTTTAKVANKKVETKKTTQNTTIKKDAVKTETKKTATTVKKTSPKNTAKNSVKKNDDGKEIAKIKASSTLKSDYKSKESPADLKKQLEDKLQAAIESVRQAKAKK